MVVMPIIKKILRDVLCVNRERDASHVQLVRG